MNLIKSIYFVTFVYSSPKEGRYWKRSGKYLIPTDEYQALNKIYRKSSSRALRLYVLLHLKLKRRFK